MGCYFLLQGIFPTQGLKACLFYVYCIGRWILYHWAPWEALKNLICVSVWLFDTLWTVTCQAPLSMESSRQEYWNGSPYPLPGCLSNPRIEWVSCTADRFFTNWATSRALQIVDASYKSGKPKLLCTASFSIIMCSFGGWGPFYNIAFPIASVLYVSTLPVQLCVHTQGLVLSSCYWIVHTPLFSSFGALTLICLTNVNRG